MRKGQVEFIAILSVIVIAVVVISLSLSQPSVPTQIPVQVQQEYRSVEDSMNNLISASADETLRKISQHGGYLEERQQGVKFLGKTVAYWQQDGIISIPEVEQNFEEGLADLVNANTAGISENIGTPVSFGSARIDARFLDNTIEITATVPTTITKAGQQFQVNPVYTVSIPSKYKEVLDFSSGFVRQSHTERYIEYFTLSSMVMSPIEDNEHVTPFIVHLTDCGEFVFKDWFSLKEAAEERIETTVGGVFMPEKVPLNTGDKTPGPKYVLTPVNGNKYTDVPVSFHLEDDFSLTTQSFSVSPNPLVVIAKPVGFTGICASDPIFVDYSLKYPVIIRAKDDLTGHVLQFAQTISINNNEPADFAAPQEQDFQAQLCASMSCSAFLRVVDVNNEPLSEARVSFMGCGLGTTDQSGVYSGAAPCGTGDLQVYKEGYAPVIESLSYSQLLGQDVSMQKHLTIPIAFYEVTVVNDTFTRSYSVTDIVPIEDRRVALSFQSLSDYGKVHSRFFSSALSDLTAVPEDDYAVSATLMSSDMKTPFGGFTVITSLLEKDVPRLHVYIPKLLGYGDGGRPQMNADNYVLTSVLANCGIQPLSTEQIDPDTIVVCTKTYSEV